MTEAEIKIYEEVEKHLPNMSEVEKGIAINHIKEGWNAKDIIDSIVYGGWLGEYIDQVFYEDEGD